KRRRECNVFSTVFLIIWLTPPGRREEFYRKKRRIALKERSSPPPRYVFWAFRRCSGTWKRWTIRITSSQFSKYAVAGAQWQNPISVAAVIASRFIAACAS